MEGICRHLVVKLRNCLLAETRTFVKKNKIKNITFILHPRVEHYCLNHECTMLIHLFAVYQTNAQLQLPAIKALLYLPHDGKVTRLLCGRIKVPKVWTCFISTPHQRKHTIDLEEAPWCECLRCTVQNQDRRTVPKSFYFFVLNLTFHIFNRKKQIGIRHRSKKRKKKEIKKTSSQTEFTDSFASPFKFQVDVNKYPVNQLDRLNVPSYKCSDDNSGVGGG